MEPVSAEEFERRMASLAANDSNDDDDDDDDGDDAYQMSAQIPSQHSMTIFADYFRVVEKICVITDRNMELISLAKKKRRKRRTNKRKREPLVNVLQSFSVDTRK